MLERIKIAEICIESYKLTGLPHFLNGALCLLEEIKNENN